MIIIAKLIWLTCINGLQQWKEAFGQCRDFIIHIGYKKAEFVSPFRSVKKINIIYQKRKREIGL